MSLKFNTYRAKRYLRSRFVEGKYLLASEASDLQLESLQVLRKAIEKSLGSAVAIDDAWKVELINSTQILIKPGQAWVKGLPVEMRSGGDQLVSGAVLTVGIVPVGVSVSDEPNGNGKILTFNDGATTPTNTYRLIVSAQEELITDVDDPFLKNINLTESTAQKVRLVYRLNLVPVSLQSTSPVPYRDENSTSLSATNFPNSGGFAAPNLSNEVIVTPAPAGNGELISTSLITGSEGIDGRDVELVIRNDGGLGGIVLPNNPVGQQAFANSTLIDSNGNIYHVNAIFNDTVSTQLVLRIDKEVDQPNPQIINGSPFKLIKRDVFVTDDVNGSPQGKVYWDVADLEWHQVNEFVHQSNITDLRKVVNPVQMFQETTNQKYNLRPVGGGNVNWDLANQLITWSSSILLLNAHGANQTIPSATVPILEGGSLHYVLKMAGGSIERGTLAVNVTAFGATSSLSAVNLSDVHVGNVIVDSAGTVAEITDIDDVNNTVTTSPALTANGAATIYKDSYGPGKAPLSSLSYVLAVRYNNKVYVGGTLELEDGETSQIGDGVTSALLTFIGSTDENDDSPNYTSEVYISDGDSLVSAISSLDAALDSLAGTVASINWKAPVANYAALPAVGNVDGDARITLDTRAIYTWDNANTVWVETGYWKSPVANAAALPLTNNKNGDIRITLDTHLPYYWDSGSSSWKPVNSAGGGVKIIGGGTLTWNSGSGELTFSAPMYLEFKGLAYTDNTIPITQSPITLASNFDVAYVLPNFSTGGPALSVTVAALSAVPANALIIARREGSDVIVGSSSTRLKNGQATELYAQTSNQNLAFMGANNTADAFPSYSSNIRGTANENLTARAGVLTDAMGDSQEDRSAYLRANDPVTWTGSQLQFTSDIVLEIVNTKSGAVKTSTILLANSPISLADGESAWVLINRTLASENLTVNLSGTTPIPAQTQANKDVIIIGRRQDALGAGYLHIPLHKQVLEPGQTVRLGASGSGDVGSLLAALDRLDKNYIINGAYDLWQRGGVSGGVNVSGTLTYVGPDRWRTLFTGTHSFTPNVRRSTTVPDNSVRFSNRWDFQRNASAAILAQEQRIEAANCTELVDAGKLSISLFVNSTVAPVGTLVRLFLYTPTVVDNHTVQNTMYSTTTSLSSANTWTEIKFENITVTTAALLGLGVRIEFSYPSGTDGSTQSAFITKVVLNAGDTARTFTRFGKNLGQEIVAAQRYFEKSYALETAPGSVTTHDDAARYQHWSTTVNTDHRYTPIQFTTRKRVAPQVFTYSLNGLQNRGTNYGPDTDFGVNSAEPVIMGETNFSARNGTGGNLSLGTLQQILYHWTADAEL